MADEMPYKMYQLVYDLRVTSKEGGTLSKENIKYLEECFKKYPEDYKRIGREVFEATKPFGSI